MWRIEQIEREPSSRCAHQADSIDDYLYVFAGWNDENQMLNDIHRLNINTWEWEELNQNNLNNSETNQFIPTPRNGHTMNSYGNQLVVFGGGSFSGFLNDVITFSVETLRWTQVNTIVSTNSNKPAPSGRSKHASCLLGDKLYIFGGGDGIRLYNDMFYLDLKSWQWNYVDVAGEITPPPRWGHTMVKMDDKNLLLFGGHSGTKRLNDLYLFVVDSGQWIQIDYSKIEGNLIPHSRAGHSASMIMDKHMMLFGGGDGKIINENYLLDTTTWKWWKLNNTAPEGRCAHSATLIKNKLVIYGGGNGLQCLKKLVILDSIDQIENLYIQYKELKDKNLNRNVLLPESTNNNNNRKKEIKRIKNQINDISSTLSQLSSTIELKAKKILEVKEKEKQLLSPPSSRSKPIHLNNTTHYEDKLKNSRLNRYEIRDITYFLNQIGMSKFVNKFIEEEIEITVLHLLTEDHLKEIGIQSLGDRLSIIKGIRELTLPIFKGSPRISMEYDPNYIPQFINDDKI